MYNIAIVGLGYVGRPLGEALYHAGHNVIGYDINADRAATFNLTSIGTTDPAVALPTADFIIVCVPTDVDASRKPDLGPLLSAAATIGKYVKKGAIVILESTVAPHCTLRVFKPAIAAACNHRQFSVAFSSERVVPGNPRDDGSNLHGSKRTLANTYKVMCGEDPAITAAVVDMYSSICPNIHRTETIAGAETSKLMENCQRDLNIAFMNEFVGLCDSIGVDFYDAWAAACTKWNFHAYRPGLVGGHCIGVDPFYVIDAGLRKGYVARLLAEARHINEGMAEYCVDYVVRVIRPQTRVVGILGYTFKENVDDGRNSRVEDIRRLLLAHGMTVIVYDPRLSDSDADHYGVFNKFSEFAASVGPDGDNWNIPRADGFILAVAHDEFVADEGKVSAWRNLLSTNGFIFDVPGALLGKAEWVKGCSYHRF